MDNVYRRVASFYLYRPRAAEIVRRARVERYFRRLAWAGGSETGLRRIWGAVSALFAYMLDMRLTSFYALTKYDYMEAFYQYADARPRLRLNEKNVSAFFDALEAFLREMTKEDAEISEVLAEGRGLFFEGGSFRLPERQEYDEFCDALEHMEDIGPEGVEHLNEILDGLISSMSAYFRGKAFKRDFERAAMLYSGPPEFRAEEDEEDFWFGFWDYFFFDYHLMAEDVPPIRFFFEREKLRLSQEERYVLRDLTQARFTVFSVDYVDEDIAVCTNLFSGERMELPCPDAFYVDYRKMIFFGHLQRRGVMLLNYISAAPASERLRRRIKDEVLRQFEGFKRYQMPQATLADFFARHAAAVRHTIHVLSGFAQIKVAPHDDFDVPKRVAPNAALLEPEEGRLEAAAQKLNFSAYAIFLAKRLYEDYTARAQGRGSAAALAAVLLLIEGINGLEYVPARKIFAAFRTTQEEVLAAADEIGTRIGCTPLDPRYLTEEGYVQRIYSV